MDSKKDPKDQIIQKLNREVNNWENIFNSLKDAAMILDSKSLIIKVNAAMLKFLNKPMDEIIGKPCFEVVHNAKLPIYLCPLEIAKKTKKYQEVELYLSDKDMHVIVSVDCCFDDKGDVFQTFHVMRDITESKKAQEALQEAYNKLKQIQTQLIQAEKMSALGVLASGVAHEVKNPLGIIIQAANYLESTVAAENKDTVKVINMIKEAVVRADGIIHGLLDYSRASTLELKPENINEILGKSLDLIKHRKEFKIIEVIDERKEVISKTLVDKNKLQQVFINLMTNSLHAMAKAKNGKLILRSYEKILDEIQAKVGRRALDFFVLGEKVIAVEIEDTGVGVSKENLKKIWDPFFSTKGPREGAGLGLSICANIIDLHRGLIKAESQEGKGTIITIILMIIKEKT